MRWIRGCAVVVALACVASGCGDDTGSARANADSGEQDFDEGEGGRGAPTTVDDDGSLTDALGGSLPPWARLVPAEDGVVVATTFEGRLLLATCARDGRCEARDAPTGDEPVVGFAVTGDGTDEGLLVATVRCRPVLGDDDCENAGGTLTIHALDDGSWTTAYTSPPGDPVHPWSTVLRRHGTDGVVLARSSPALGTSLTWLDLGTGQVGGDVHVDHPGSLEAVTASPDGTVDLVTVSTGAGDGPGGAPAGSDVVTTELVGPPSRTHHTVLPDGTTVHRTLDGAGRLLTTADGFLVLDLTDGTITDPVDGTPVARVDPAPVPAADRLGTEVTCSSWPAGSVTADIAYDEATNRGSVQLSWYDGTARSHRIDADGVVTPRDACVHDGVLYAITVSGSAGLESTDHRLRLSIVDAA